MDTNLKVRKGKLGRVITGVIIFIIVLTLFLIWIINSTFLEDFYLSNKVQSITRVFTELENASAKDRLYTAEFAQTLEDMSARENISCIVISPEGTVLLSTRMGSQRIVDHLFSVLFNPQEAPLVETDRISVRPFRDSAGLGDYLTLWGGLPDGNTVFMETAMQSIRDSVSITNRFLIIAGAAAIVIGIILAIFMTGRILKPLKELADISDRMAHMDFEARYTPSKSNNEIDTLGLSMNEMSRIIEDNIGSLKEVNVNLNRDIKRYEESELMRREFVRNVSHELKTPISLIMGYAEGLRDGIAKSPEDMEFYTGVIADEAGRMDKLIQGLLDLNSIEYGNAPIRMLRIDLSEVLRQETETVMILAKNEGITISLEIPDSVTVWCDESLMRQVIDNYLTNAIRYAEGEKQIRITIETTDTEALLKVFNSFPGGIPEDETERLWDQFYKSDPARSRKKGGSGLGLSIVKALAESLGSRYGVYNSNDEVCFYFSFDRENKKFNNNLIF